MEKWIINYDLFKKTELNDNSAIVIRDIIDEIDRLIPTGPPLGFKPVNLINDHESGPTLFWPLGRDFYKIGLNISGVYYNQIAFQFTQEFLRLYCDPRISNWFVEIICHIGALYILDYLSRKWESNPPNDELKDYWENFDSYKSNLIGAAFSKVDMVKYQVSNEWVPYQINKLRKKDRLNRGKIIIIAYETLPYFKDNPESWMILPYIGKHSVPAPPADPKDLVTNHKTKPDFNSLLDHVPENLKPFIERLYTKFGLPVYT